MHAVLPALLTADEFLAVADRGGGKLELVRGEVRPVSPTNWRHTFVGLNLYDRLMPFVRARKLGRAIGDNAGFLLPLPPELQRPGPDGE